jgi:hypothetical protein
MSITNDIRNYADNALEQGKHVVGQAHAQLNDLRAQAEKSFNVDQVKSSVEPYLAQAKQYGSELTGRAEGLIETVKKDPRVGKAVTSAEELTAVVVATVHQRVVRPVVSLTGRGTAPAPRPRAAKPATTRPAAAKAQHAPAKSSARKAPAKKTQSSTSGTAKKNSAS